MKEIARKGVVKIIWNGKDITTDVSKYISSISYTDHEEGMSDEATFTFDNSTQIWSEDWYPTQGDTIELYMGYNDKIFKCGLFEVDEIVLAGPPNTIEIKTIAAGITKALRTRNNHAFEAQTLRQIALYFCNKHGFTLVDNSSLMSQINVERKTQENKTDLAFLSEIAKEYGLIFSLRGSKLQFTSYYDLDNAEATKDIDVTNMGSYSIKEKTYDTYASAEFVARNKKKGKIVKSTVTAVSLNGNITVKDVYKTKGSGKNTQQGERKNYAGLWNKNKFKQTCTVNGMEGDPELEAGINFNLTGIGLGSGKYHLVSTTHTISGDSAYTMDLDMRKTGTIPKAKRVPKIGGTKAKKKKKKSTGSSISLFGGSQESDGED